MEWEVDQVDISAYLERIGHVPVARPTLDMLKSLHEAHVRSIPFENLDSACGMSPSLAMNDVQSKLVGKRRGGYCYEHVMLFSAVLERLGFQVKRRASRMFPLKPGTISHALIEVNPIDDDKIWLADVGFGAGIIKPMPIVSGEVVDQMGVPHRIVQGDQFWCLEKLDECKCWVPQHEWARLPVRKVDFIMFNYYVSTFPESMFFGRPIVWVVQGEKMRRLIGNKITTIERNKPDQTEYVPVSSAESTLKALGLELNADLLRCVLDAWP